MASVAMATVQSVDAQTLEMLNYARDFNRPARGRTPRGSAGPSASEGDPDGLDDVELDVEQGNDEDGGSTAETEVAATRPRRIRRLQEAIRDVIREHYLCMVLVWLLFVLALAIATFVTFIEMLIVFRRHGGDPCDVPLAVFVWINIVTFIYHNTLHLCIQRWLGYDPTLYNTDEPIPEAVARYEAFVQFWSFLLCIAGVILVCEAETCPDTAPELYKVWKLLHTHSPLPSPIFHLPCTT